MFEYYQSADLVVFLVTAYFLIAGFVRGFVSELFSLISVAISFTVAALCSVRFCPYVGRFKNSVARYSSLFAVSLLLFFLIGYVSLWISHKLSHWIKRSKINLLDKLLGFIFGSVKAFLILVVCANLAKEFYPEFTAHIENSKSYKFFTSDHAMILHARDLIANLYLLLKNWSVELLQKCIGHN